MTLEANCVEIIGHRGSSFVAPENTLASFKLGWQETTTCELDVQLTSDGKLLVIHDETTMRTTAADFKVSEQPFSRLRQLDAGAFKGIQWKGEKLPSLEEVIALMPADKRLLIEIKAGPEAIPELVRIIDTSGKAKQLAIQSFHYQTCAEAKKELSKIPVYLLMASQQNLPNQAWPVSIDEAILRIRDDVGLDGLGVDKAILLDAFAVQKIRSNGLRLNVWTVDRVPEAKKLIELGVDGLITNRPGWLKTQLMEALK